LIEGKKVGIATSDLDVNILVEADRVSDIRLGIIVRDGSQEPDQKPKIVEGGFVLDQSVDKSKFYEKWGVSPSALPFSLQSNDAFKAEIQDRLNDARKSDKILMLQFGANWCPDCLVLSRTLSSDTVRDYFKGHFVLVNIDVGRFQKNIDIAASFGVDIAAGIPAAAFVFPDGARVSTTGFGELTDSRSYNPDEILAFLEDVVSKKSVHRVR
jgi:protein disulfide-isomerase